MKEGSMVLWWCLALASGRACVVAVEEGGITPVAYIIWLKRQNMTGTWSFDRTIPYSLLISVRIVAIRYKNWISSELGRFPGSLTIYHNSEEIYQRLSSQENGSITWPTKSLSRLDNGKFQPGEQPGSERGIPCRCVPFLPLHTLRRRCGGLNLCILATLE